MRTITIFACYLIWVFAGAALVAPWIFWLSTGTFAASYPFHRFVNRCLIAMALIGIFPLIKALKMEGWRSLGLSRREGKWRQWAAGFTWGAGALLVIAAGALLLGVRQLNVYHSAHDWLRHLQNALLAAFLVSFIEEIIFRGCLFKAFRRDLSFVGAAGISAAIYSLVHFFSKPTDPATVTFTSGFSILGEMLAGFTEIQTVIPGFLTLWVVGVLLAWAFEKTGSLYFSIGLHAGLILWVKSFGFLTRETSGDYRWFWGSNKLVDGWGVLLIIFVTFLAVQRKLASEKRGQVAFRQ